ncbi:MAG: cysteine desulfuration protein SufE [Rhizobiales bacterium]|nr:cysteine desulfuration protein SufE [Hyphomicrobiales bacterium]
MASKPADIDAIREDFAYLDDWEDRYRYVIELGRALPVLASEAHNDANKVRGCASQVWLETHVIPTEDPANPRLEFLGDSDASIVKGLIAVLFALMSGRRAREILEIDAQSVFAELGLTEHLTPQRSNGLASMVERVRADARRASAVGSGGGSA